MKNKRLLLTRETLRQLTSKDTGRVHGAASAEKTCHSGLTCPLPITHVGVCLSRPSGADTVFCGSLSGTLTGSSGSVGSGSGQSISRSVDFSVG